MARAELLGNNKEILVLLLKNFQLFLPFVFRLIVLFHSLSPTYHISYQSILDVPVGAHASTVLSTMQRILLLRYSCLLAKKAIVLGTVMLMRLFMGYVFGA